MAGLSNEKLQDRRGFLLENFRALGRLFAESVNETITRAGGGQKYLRPPGAVDEAAFLLSCTRCKECAKACPTNAIVFLPPNAGAAVGTPTIEPHLRACEICLKCIPVCEPKALLPVAEPRQVRMGTAVLNQSACWAYQGQVCQLCYQRCPFPDEAIKLTDGKPEIIPQNCTGCGMCAYVCVSTPIAINITPIN